MMMQLTPLDAEFLDGMLAQHEVIKKAAADYVSASDASSNPTVVDMARGLLEQLNYMDEEIKAMRGFAEGDQLRREAVEAGVEVTAAY